VSGRGQGARPPSACSQASRAAGRSPRAASIRPRVTCVSAATARVFTSGCASRRRGASRARAARASSLAAAGSRAANAAAVRLRQVARRNCQSLFVGSFATRGSRRRRVTRSSASAATGFPSVRAREANAEWNAASQRCISVLAGSFAARSVMIAKPF